MIPEELNFILADFKYRIEKVESWEYKGLKSIYLDLVEFADDYNLYTYQLGYEYMDKDYMELHIRYKTQSIEDIKQIVSSVDIKAEVWEVDAYGNFHDIDYYTLRNFLDHCKKELERR